MAQEACRKIGRRPVDSGLAIAKDASSILFDLDEPQA